MSFNDYYQAELTYLRDMGRAFAEAHPAIAGLLAERGTDPDVERLLEGFAFLAGRIHQRIDAALPALVDGLAELLLPHFCRVTPACSTLEFRPDIGKQRGRQQVPAGTSVRTRAVQGTPCTFRTCAELDLLPAMIVAQQLDDTSASRPELVLSLALAAGARDNVLTQAPLRLHAHGDLPLASHLLLWMLRHCIDVVVEAGGQRVSLGRDCVRWAGMCTGSSLWPWPELSPRAMCLLLEYFTLPSKFLYFEVHRLERAAQIDADEIRLRFVFDRPPPFPGRLPDDMLRLHCVPVSNLFEVDGIPITLTSVDRAHMVRANELEPTHAEVFSVDRVIGSRRGSRPRQYHSFYSFAHALYGDAGYYVLSREASPVDEAVHHSLRLTGPRDSAIGDEPETLSLELTCTNRSLPHQLQVGDLHVPTTGCPTGVPFQNIERVTRPCRPPLGSELQWRLLSHLAASQRSLGSADVLRTILSLYNWQTFSDVVAARGNDRRIASVRRVTVATATRVVEGAAIRGLNYTVELEQSGFASAGDIFLFGSVLNELLGAQAPVNAFSELCLAIHPSGGSLAWKPRVM